MWLSNVAEKISRSPGHGMAKSSVMSSKQCSKNRWKHAGEFINRNGVWTHSYNPHRVTNAVYLPISGSNSTDDIPCFDLID